MDLDGLIEKMKALSVEELEGIKEKCSAETKDLYKKMMAICKHIRESAKEARAEASKLKTKENYEKNKQEKADRRNQTKTFTVRLGAMEVRINAKLCTTVGKLRLMIADALNLSAKVGRKLTLSIGGVIISGSPRKTLVGLHIFENAVITCAMPGFQHVAVEGDQNVPDETSSEDEEADEGNDEAVSDDVFDSLNGEK